MLLRLQDLKPDGLEPRDNGVDFKSEVFAHKGDPSKLPEGKPTYNP
jgi:hypothetical protein